MQAYDRAGKPVWWTWRGAFLSPSGYVSPGVLRARLLVNAYPDGIQAGSRPNAGRLRKSAQRDRA